MKRRCQKLFPTVKDSSGFTLIEMLIVIIILGILAMVIIPQISVSTEDAKVSTLKTNLTGIRSAIEVYYAQHNMTYPGVKTAGGSYGAADTAAAFVSQLTMYSNADGAVAVAYNATTAPFGPYIKGGALPPNPFNNKADVSYDTAVVDITNASGANRTADGTTGWKFLSKFGIIFANDNTSSGGVAHSTY